MNSSSDQPDWKNSPERGSELGLKVMAWLSQKAGRRVVRIMLYPVAAWYWLRTPAARLDSARYLTRVLGRPVQARDTFAHYCAFASTVLDRTFLLRGQQELFEVEVVGRDMLFERLGQGRGVFMVGAHLGSFEALRVMARGHESWRVSMAMFEDNARTMGTFLRTIDPQLAQMIIPLGKMDSMLQIQDRLDRGDMVGFLADRSIGNDPVQTVDFLGFPAHFPTGVFRMAAVLRRPVIAMAGLYMGGNRYRLHFIELNDFTKSSRGERKQAISAAVRAYAHTLETLCREAPLNWFNFFDFWASARTDALNAETRADQTDSKAK